MNFLLELSVYLLPLFFLFKRSYATSIYIWIFGFFLLSSFLRKAPPFFRTETHLPVLVFMLFVFGTSLYQIGLHQTWVEGKRFFYGIVLFVILVDLIRRNEIVLSRLFLLLFLTALFLDIDTLRQWLHGVDLLQRPMMDEGRRATAVFLHANYLGLYLSGVVPIQGYYIIMKKNPLKFLSIVVFILTVLSIGLSECRSAWVAFIFFLTILLISKRKGSSVILILSLLALVIFISSNFSYVHERVTHSFSHDELRLDHWSQTTKLIHSQSFWGAGLDTFKDLYPKYNITSENISGPHNFFLEVWQTSGIIGMLLFAFVLYRILRYSVEYAYKSETILVTQLSFWMTFIASVINIPFFSRYVAFSFWYFLGIMIGSIELYRCKHDAMNCEESVLLQ